MTHTIHTPRSRAAALLCAALALPAALAGCGSSHGAGAANQGAETPPPIAAPPPPSTVGQSAAKKAEEAELQKAREAAKKRAEQEAAAAAAGGGVGPHGRVRHARHGRAGRRSARKQALVQQAEAEKRSESSARTKFQSEEAAELKSFKSKERQESKTH